MLQQNSYKIHLGEIIDKLEMPKWRKFIIKKLLPKVLAHDNFCTIGDVHVSTPTVHGREYNDKVLISRKEGCIVAVSCMSV